MASRTSLFQEGLRIEPFGEMSSLRLVGKHIAELFYRIPNYPGKLEDPGMIAPSLVAECYFKYPRLDHNLRIHKTKSNFAMAR